ncbi:transmembrane protein, putative (macronuclear) [Tetrahymena thermophila SB210]|uniref:Transmembrane protein, putative n=1 Tax=Tetrahymena thermophila (strain SB210) TaxID=312017 RepID=I7M6S4_TETTS|nr:transmembrane protein, putative [Tetrahymena thermophila SB210]EAR86027.3 transmembrane protein, putative [Tetrahymena thermophila SB210]|eukprot:XP_976622.3 transmembrane protein, putative [Tetrahymena thermophila SB210]
MSETKTISTLKKFDIFALPFQFTFGNNEKEKKTIIGGLISMAILIVSSIYFGYLCYLYFQNKVQPQVVSSNIFQKSPYTMQFQQNFISVQVIMPNGQNLYDYQQQTGKVYLNIISINFKSGVNFKFTPYPLIPCRDESLQGYLCLDSSKVGDSDNLFSLTYNPDNIEENQFSIMFGICDPNFIQSPYTCEDEQVTKQLEDRIIKEIFYFDIYLGFYTKFHLQKTDLTQQQGFIIQNSDYDTYFSGFARRDIFSSQQLIKSQLQMNVLGALEFFLGSESISLNIQFPQFTSLLAQFTSVFNSLLFLGIISKFFAESEIFSQVAEMQLKIYFKKSALFILKQIGQGENIQRDQKQGLEKLLSYIKNADFKNLGKKMKISFFRKIMYVFMGNIKNEKKETIQEKLFKQIVSQSNKALNIFEIQKELLQMKIMMRLILSVEQYAAIQLCGSKLPICNDKQKEQDQEVIEESQISNQIVSVDQKLEKSNEIKEDKQNFEDRTQNNILSFSREKQESVRKFNGTVYPISIEQQIFDKRKTEKNTKLISHLEKIDMIERDEGFFKDCLDKFLQNKSKPQSEIDQRILECMIGLDDPNCMPDSLAVQSLKKIDIFALPFQFSFGNNEKEKKTIAGGLISISVLVVSLIYFIYLCYLYFQNKIQPQVVQTNVFQQDPFSISFQQDFISVQIIMPNGQSLYDYQKSTGKIYLNVISNHFKNGTELKFNTFPLVPCLDSQLQGYMCFDQSKFGNSNGDFEFLYNPNNIEQSKFNIFFAICDQSTTPSPYICENEQIIRDTVLTYSTQINLRISLSQYNTQTKQLEKRIMQEPAYFDTNMGFYFKIALQKTNLVKQEGLIIQSSEYKTYFSGYTRKDFFATQSLVENQLQMKAIGIFEIFIGSEGQNLYVQYPQFTFLLAQFTSVFNSLLFIGIFSKFFAETEIFCIVADIQLKFYFKKSALFILKQLGKENEIKIAQEQGLDKLSDYIKKADFKNFGQKMKISLFRKILYLFIGEDNKKDKETIQHKLFKQIVSQSKKAINIFEIQKELLQLKIMMRLLLSAEQYAAIQLCGSSLPLFQDQQDVQVLQEKDIQKEDNSQKVVVEEEEDNIFEIKEEKQTLGKSQNNILSFTMEKQDSAKKGSSSVYPIQINQIEKQVSESSQKKLKKNILSHLEKLDLIDRNEEYFKKFLERFLESKNQKKSKVDKRIIECMIGLNGVYCNENSIEKDMQKVIKNE